MATTRFPAELTGRRQWLVWRYVMKPGQRKPSKMPYYATTGQLRGWPMGRPRDGHASDQHPQVEQGHALDREHLTDYETAAAFAAARRFDGVGFAFLPGDGLIGIDLDSVVGGDDDRAALGVQIMVDCDTYCELSPSGTGLHIIGMGDIETFKDNGIGVEVFCGRQFFTMTGEHCLGTPLDVREIPDETLGYLRGMVEQARADRRPVPAHAPAQATPAPGTTAASHGDAGRYCLAALDSAVQRLRGAAEGGRNDLLNAEAYGLGQLLHTGGISEATVRAALTDAAVSCGLPAGEIAATLRSGIEGGKRAPRAIPQRQHQPMAASAPAAAARTAEFLRLFRALPGPRRVDRIRQVCACCCVREGTVRQWLCTPPYRTPSERVLVMLRR